MPRARKKKQPESPASIESSEPTPIADVLETLPVVKMIEQPQADAAVEAFKKQREREQAVSEPAQSTTEPALSDALAELLEARRRKSEIEPERAMSEPETIGQHTSAVLARRPTLAPAPPGYYPVSSDRQAGLRVSKAHDQRSSAIQFAEDRLPTRAEKDVLERIGHPPDGQNFVYRSERRQWERETPPGWTAGENTIDAHRVMSDLARGRNEGLER